MSHFTSVNSFIKQSPYPTCTEGQRALAMCSDKKVMTYAGFIEHVGYVFVSFHPLRDAVQFRCFSLCSESIQNLLTKGVRLGDCWLT